MQRTYLTPHGWEGRAFPRPGREKTRCSGRRPARGWLGSPRGDRAVPSSGGRWWQWDCHPRSRSAGARDSWTWPQRVFTSRVSVRPQVARLSPGVVNGEPRTWTQLLTLVPRSFPSVLGEGGASISPRGRAPRRAALPRSLAPVCSQLWRLRVTLGFQDRFLTAGPVRKTGYICCCLLCCLWSKQRLVLSPSEDGIRLHVGLCWPGRCEGTLSRTWIPRCEGTWAGVRGPGQMRGAPLPHLNSRSSHLAAIRVPHYAGYSLDVGYYDTNVSKRLLFFPS